MAPARGEGESPGGGSGLAGLTDSGGGKRLPRGAPEARLGVGGRQTNRFC